MLQDKIKNIFDKRVKEDDFFIGHQVLRWDARREDKGKHGKFDFLWEGPYVIYGYRGNNLFFIRNLDGTELQEGLVNGRMLKHYHSSQVT